LFGDNRDVFYRERPNRLRGRRRDSRSRTQTYGGDSFLFDRTPGASSFIADENKLNP